jgi:NMD protein affecting ribosome stability and mRNA decay
MPCNRCGASIDTRADVVHLCDDERRLDFAVFELRDELESFEDCLRRWLATPQGRFEQFYAERERSA